MKKEPVFISVSNQKGGIGKTTYTVLPASYLHYRLGLRVLVADCYFPQWSVNAQRERETALLRKGGELKDLFVSQCRDAGSKAYPIVKTKPEQAVSDVVRLIGSESEPYDVVLLDLPGTLNTGGVFHTISMLDYVFVPIKADKMVVESSLMYPKVIQEQLIGKPNTNLKGIYLFWTMVDRRERTLLFEQYANVFATLGLSLLETMIPARSKFNKELTDAGAVCRSTLFPPDNAFIRDCRLAELAGEILNFTKITAPCPER